MATAMQTPPVKTSRGWSPWRRQMWVEVNGYRVGDLQLDEPIFVAAGASIVGNVIAPQLQIAGRIYGTAVAQETTILPTGQVWGDVYAGSLHIEPGGRIQGWICALDTASYRQMREAGVVAQLDPGAYTPELPADGRSPAAVPLLSQSQINLIRQLQTEAATALAARRELEETFEKRLAEVAGDTAAQVTQLTDQLQRTQQTIANLQRDLQNGRQELQTRDLQLERQGNELIIARQLLSERNQELDTTRQTATTQANTIKTLQTTKTKLDEDFRLARQQIDQQQSRLNSLEVTLQANLQHSAEQEDALIRWQELAEATEKRCHVLENELQQLKSQTTEQLRYTEILQAQRRQLEEDLEWAMTELDALRRKDTVPLSALSIADQDRLRELEKQTARLAELEQQAAWATELASQLNDLEEKAQDQTEQLLWLNANLETSRRELEQMRQITAVQSNQLQAMQSYLEEQTANEQQWQQERAKAQATFQKMVAERRQLQEARRQAQIQIEGYEVELARHLEETRQQGQHLAEARTLLAERDLMMRQAMTRINQQEQAMTELKQAAAQRIQQLQTQLRQAQQQLADVTAVLERRQKRS